MKKLIALIGLMSGFVVTVQAEIKTGILTNQNKIAEVEIQEGEVAEILFFSNKEHQNLLIMNNLGKSNKPMPVQNVLSLATLALEMDIATYFKGYRRGIRSHQQMTIVSSPHLVKR